MAYCIWKIQVGTDLFLNGVLGNELIDVNSSFLANPRRCVYQTTHDRTVGSLPIASVDGLTLDAFLPPTGVEEIS
jgi:hypothetical protein